MIAEAAHEMGVDTLTENHPIMKLV